MDEVRVGASSCSSEAVQAQTRNTVEDTTASSSSGWGFLTPIPSFQTKNLKIPSFQKNFPNYHLFKPTF
jgi:hypothetical protein